MSQKKSEGTKDDKGKPAYHLLPPEMLDELADLLGFGAEKYGERNWELGMDWSRLFAASMRHMWAWWRRETSDPETGRSHLVHALACIVFLLVYEKRKTGTDDRPHVK